MPPPDVGSSIGPISLHDAIGGERKYILATSDGGNLIARHQVGTGEVEPHPGDEVIACWQIEHGVVVFDQPSRGKQPEQKE
jgi:hypothetical protein